MEPAKLRAAQILAALGFRVDAIPVGSTSRADLRVADETSVYHIEVKEKCDAAAMIAERSECLARGDVYSQSDLLAYSNRISGVLREARDQLDATPNDSQAFQLIWLHVAGPDADMRWRRAFATFYGDVPLIPVKPRRKETISCFYFDYSVAIEMPTIDALILTEPRSLQLCLNEFSNRADTFRAAKLCQALRAGAVDPVVLTAAGQIIACRSTIPRKNDDDTIRVLREQTGVLYLPIRLTRHASSAAITCSPPASADLRTQA